MQSMSLFLLLASCPFDRLYQPSSLCCYHHSLIQSSIHLLTNEQVIASNRKSMYTKKKFVVCVKKKRESSQITLIRENLLEHNDFHGHAVIREIYQSLLYYSPYKSMPMTIEQQKKKRRGEKIENYFSLSSVCACIQFWRLSVALTRLQFS